VLAHYYGPFYMFSVILVASLFFGVGLVVSWKKPEDPAARVYHFGSVATAIQLSTTWGSYQTTPPELGPLLRVAFSSVYAFIPVLFLHLTVLFPRPRRSPASTLLPVLYGLAVILAVCTSATFVEAWSARSVELFHTHRAWFSATRVFLVVLVFGGLWMFQQSYVRAGGEPERRKLRWVLWGMFVGFFPFVVLWVIPSMILTYGLVPEAVMLLASGFIPLAFGVSIIKYHIMDIDLLLNRSMVYGTVMALVVLVYVTIVGGLAAVVTQSTYELSMGLSTGAAILIALFFEPTRRAVQQIVDRRFFRVRYDFRRAARRFQDDVKTCVTVDDIVMLLVERIASLLPVEGIGFLLMDPGRPARWISAQGIIPPAGDDVSVITGLADRARGIPLVSADAVEPEVLCAHADPELCADWHVAFLYTITRSDNTPLGMLLLGSKKAGTRFSSEDADLLGSLAVNAGVEMDRILLQRSVMEKADEAGRLQRLNSMKSDFVSYVSHELRTPLTSIKMFAELLAERLPGRDQRAREYVQIIEGESERLQRMVDTILDSAKIDAGGEQYNMRPLHCAALLRDVIRTMKYQLNKEGFRVELAFARTARVKPANAYRIHADPDAVREAVLNLMTNAMKYSGESKRIRVSLNRTAHDIRCCVEDRGLGIPAGALHHLFEKFFRDPSLPHRIQGVGLGLSVVKHIMTAHGGSVEVKSVPGKGSAFTLVFPISRTAGPRMRRSPERQGTV
jgi:signal transduction histidine kinase